MTDRILTPREYFSNRKSEMTNRERLLRKLRMETNILNQTLNELADECIAVNIKVLDHSRELDIVKRYGVSSRELSVKD